MMSGGDLQVDVDFVLFENGTYWGADHSQTLKHIQEHVQTQAATRRAVLNDLNSKSAESVKQDLQKQVDDTSQEKYLKARKVSDFRRHN
jgi:hypothetical protein